MGKIAAKILDPSKGGIGIRFKAASPRLRAIVLMIMADKVGLGKKGKTNLKIKVKKTAIKILVKGPARPVIPMSFLGSLKLNGSMGTGLAAPKTTGELVKMSKKGKTMLIKRSIWGMGFRVNRPRILAVGSPRRSATYP